VPERADEVIVFLTFTGGGRHDVWHGMGNGWGRLGSADLGGSGDRRTDQIFDVRTKGLKMAFNEAKLPLEQV
jgi:hypothetical protein